MSHPSPADVTLLLLLYNQGRYVEGALDALAAQSTPARQVIVNDDGSADDGPARVSAWLARHPGALAGVTFHRAAANQGITRTLNALLPQVRGRYLGVSAADDLLHPDFVARQQASLDADSGAVMTFTDADVIDERGAAWHESFIASVSGRAHPAKGADMFLALCRGNLVAAPTVLMRTSALREVGGWDESLSYEDWDMWLRLARHGRVVFDPRPVASYRRSATSLSARLGSDRRHQASTLRIIEKSRGVSPEADAALAGTAMALALTSYREVGRRAAPFVAAAAEYGGISASILARGCQLGLPVTRCLDGRVALRRRLAGVHA